MGRPNPQTEKLLALSVEQYRELLQNAENLFKILEECDYSQVEEHVRRMHRLQTEARKQDEQLLPQLMVDFDVWREAALYQLRLGYINSIRELNELLVSKVRGMMAVTSVELKKMRGGRTVLAGYAPQTSIQIGLRGIG